jgi:hypothetical protein
MEGAALAVACGSRRKHCTSPSLCFKLCGEEEPFCGPCDLQAVEALANKS